LLTGGVSNSGQAGHGLRAEGGDGSTGTLSGAGVYAVGGGSGTTISSTPTRAPALEVNEGGIRFSNTSPTYSDPVSKRLTNKNIVAGWIKLQLNGTANPTVSDGFNMYLIASAAQATYLQVDFAQSMSGHYCVNITGDHITAGQTTHLICSVRSAGSGSFRVKLVEVTEGGVITAVNPAATSDYVLHISVIGITT
jgi:hypothetical protein